MDKYTGEERYRALPRTEKANYLAFINDTISDHVSLFNLLLIYVTVMQITNQYCFYYCSRLQTVEITVPIFVSITNARASKATYYQWRIVALVAIGFRVVRTNSRALMEKSDAYPFS